jgi:hypothetical protein
VVFGCFFDARKQPYSNFAVATRYRIGCMVVIPGPNLSIAGPSERGKAAFRLFRLLLLLRMDDKVGVEVKTK